MFEKLAVFQGAYAMARHAGARQAVVAQNMANADTPGYRARDITPFSELVTQGGTGFAPRRTREGHLLEQGDSVDASARTAPEGGPANPNGNSVSLEAEMLKAVDVKRQHDRALAIYKSSLGILRTSLGKI
jgi:flagellar basal-body rod protein FlgB